MRRIMPLLFARVIVVVALKRETAKDAICLDRLTSFVLLAWLRLVGGIGSVSRFLQEEPHQIIGGLEDSATDQHFKFLDQRATGGLRLEARHQLLDFLVLPWARSGRTRWKWSQCCWGGLKHTNRQVWSAAGEMLLRVDPENHAALTRLGAGLKSSDVVSRRMAAYALGQESPLGPEAERCL